jgi:WS/DGAT/MGAT family acyltransferase
MLPTDAIFWYAEEANPQLRPLVAGLFLLDRPPDRARLRASLERLLARIPRLTQRVAEVPLHLGLPEWEDDLHFDLDYHAREVVLPAPATERHLYDFAAAVFAAPLDHLRPLWEGYLIEGLEDGRAAFFFKTHHSIMDGVGSLALFEAFTQGHRAEPVRAPRRIVPVRAPRRPAQQLIALAGDSLRAAAGSVAEAAGLVARALTDPGGVAGELAWAARSVRGLVRDFTAQTVHDPLADNATGYGRRLDAVTLSLPRMRRIKDALGATLNDIVLTAVSGAVGRYHESRHVRVHHLNCMVPINLREDHERHQLGNRVGMCNIALPVGEADPLTRLEEIRAQTAVAKGDRRGAVYPLLLRLASLLPAAAFRLFVQATVGRINLICTNVPGPPVVRYIAGAKIEAIHPFAPVMIGTPLSVALMSYGDAYCIGIDTDPAAIPDPEALHAHLEEAVAEIEQAALPQAAPRRRPSAA